MSYHRLLARSAIALASASVCLAQTPVNFSTNTTASGRTPGNVYAVDLNNDGISDLIQDTEQTPSGFTLTLANGNGSFKPPVFYSLPSKTGPNPIATGDFNNDGKVDVAVAIAGTNQVLVYLGNGDGTLQAPKTSTIALPSGYNFNLTTMAAADFNGDGKLDLAVVASSTAAGAMFVLQGDGTGAFTTPHVALSAFPGQTVVGDFDGDGKADIATTTVTTDVAGNLATTTVHVLYGNGAFGFTDTTPYTNTNPSLFSISAGDLNSDGKSDIFGTDGSSRLAVLYGTSGRTFNSYFSPLPAGYLTVTSGGYAPLLTMGDYNGDGRMDIAAFNYVPVTGGSDTYFAFFLADANPGQFTIQTVSIPGYTFFTAPVSGLFSGHLVPDIAVGASNNGGAIGQTMPSNTMVGVNHASSGYFGPCDYPSTGEGFNVCVPGYVNDTDFIIQAAVNSFGKLRKIELWIDDVKVSEQYHTWDQHGYFSYSGTANPGTHRFTLFAADVDNRLQRYDQTFTTGGGPGALRPPRRA